MEELKNIFQALDKDGNGSISFEELQFGLADRENAEELLQILKAADTDGNGTINYTGKYLKLLAQQKNVSLRRHCCYIVSPPF